MGKKSMGQFISVLRKANGMTQQDVAERLNVSNKAVSRWERDACTPDIALIPALAEMFSVTCDELLKGERIINNNQTEKAELKVEKQLKSLINRTISKFKTMIWISIALSAAGLIFMYGIYYGWDRLAIALAVMMLFEIAAFVTTAIAVSKVKEVKADNELFDSADAYLMEKLNRTLGTYSFISFFMILTVILLSVTLLSFVLFIPVLAFIFIKCKAPYTAWITGQHYTKESKPKVRRLNVLQLGTILLTAISFSIALDDYRYIPNEVPSFPPRFFVIIALTCALALFNLVCLMVFMVKYKEDRTAFLTSGIRNFLMTPSVLIFSGMYAPPVVERFETISTVDSSVCTIQVTNHYYWSWFYLCIGLAFVCTIAIIFELIKAVIKRLRKDKR